MSKEIVALKRECAATEIPSGRAITFFQGTEVIIVQMLGGSYTVMTHMGQMASIAGKDVDALGKTPTTEPAPQESGEAPSTEKLVWAQLKTCYDPEIPHSIVDLGLVYDCKITDTDEAAKKVNIKMTLTAPGCGMGPAIAEDAKSKVLLVPGVSTADVRITWDPPWNQQMISEEGKMKIGLV